MPHRSSVELTVVERVEHPEPEPITITRAEATLLHSACTKLGYHYSVLSERLDLKYLDKMAISYFTLSERLAREIGLVDIDGHDS